MDKHLKEVDESYWVHLAIALRISLYLFIISVVCLIHAILPFVFISTTKNMIAYIDQFMKDRGK